MTTQQEKDYQYVEIFDEEPTFMDDNVIGPDADIEFLHEEPAQVFHFFPLNSSLREECGPLVNIVKCGIIKYSNIGADLIGKPRNVHNVKEMATFISDASHMHCLLLKNIMTM